MLRLGTSRAEPRRKRRRLVANALAAAATMSDALVNRRRAFRCPAGAWALGLLSARRLTRAPSTRVRTIFDSQLAGLPA